MTRPDRGMRVCRDCGSAVPAGAAFCHRCGGVEIEAKEAVRKADEGFSVQDLRVSYIRRPDV